MNSFDSVPSPPLWTQYTTIFHSSLIVHSHRTPSASGRFKLVAVTNNFARSHVGIPKSELDFLGWSDGATTKEVKDLFDDYIDSSVVGLRYVEMPYPLLSL
jgi:hypothetical protein